MNLSLDQLVETTGKTPEELKKMGVPLTCPSCPGDLEYLPTKTEVEYTCTTCSAGDVAQVKGFLRLRN